jgi:hypothetical protein
MVSAGGTVGGDPLPGVGWAAWGTGSVCAGRRCAGSGLERCRARVFVVFMRWRS